VFLTQIISVKKCHKRKDKQNMFQW